VAGEGGLHGDVGRLHVADFAQHDHVGVLTQQGAQGGGEGHADLLVHLRLGDAVEVVLDRVLDGRDVHRLVLVELAEGGVERGRLARAGRPGDQDDAVGRVDLLLPDLERVLVEAEVVEADVDRLRGRGYA
jgi:hypothetical protein